MLLPLNWPSAPLALLTGAAIYEAFKIIAMVAESTRALICLIDRVYRGFEGLSNGVAELFKMLVSQVLYGNKRRYLGPKQRLGGIDVADAGDFALIHKKKFGRKPGTLGDGGESPGSEVAA